MSSSPGQVGLSARAERDSHSYRKTLRSCLHDLHGFLKKPENHNFPINPLSKVILWIVERVTVIDKNIQMAGRCVSTFLQQVFVKCLLRGGQSSR